MISVVSANLPLINAVRSAVNKAAVSHNIHLKFEHYPTCDDLHEKIRGAILVLDLTQCLKSPPKVFAREVQAWRVLYPASMVVAVHSKSPQGYEQGLLLTELLKIAHVKESYAYDEAILESAWSKYILNNPYAILIDEVRQDFMRRLKQLDLTFPNMAVLTALLQNSPYEPTVENTIHRANMTSIGVSQNWLTSKLRQAHQLPPLYLCNAFRTTVYLKMIEDTEWKASEIARFMGEPDARTLMKRAKTRLGFTLKELKTIPYGAMLSVAVDMCRPEYETTDLPPYQDLVRDRLAAYLNDDSLVARVERTARRSIVALALLLTTTISSGLLDTWTSDDDSTDDDPPTMVQYFPRASQAKLMYAG